MRDLGAGKERLQNGRQAKKTTKMVKEGDSGMLERVCACVCARARARACTFSFETMYIHNKVNNGC